MSYVTHFDGMFVGDVPHSAFYRGHSRRRVSRSSFKKPTKDTRRPAKPVRAKHHVTD